MGNEEFTLPITFWPPSHDSMQRRGMTTIGEQDISGVERMSTARRITTDLISRTRIGTNTNRGCCLRFGMEFTEAACLPW